MCVLTYVPFLDSQFVLTNNRDESTTRQRATLPQKYIICDTEVIFPKDPQAGGTWIATSEDFSLCLLNGAQQKHISKPPYKKSRGQVIVDFFTFKNVAQFLKLYDFNGIENFTLLIFEHHPITSIHQLRYDGQKLSCQIIDPKVAHIWSSSTLYTDEIVKLRKAWFQDFLSKFEANEQNLLDFHHNGGNGDSENDLKVNRNNLLKTHCITQVIKKDVSKMNFIELI